MTGSGLLHKLKSYVILGQIFGLIFSYIYTDDTTFNSKCDQVSDLCQQVELTSEFESDLWDTGDWGSKWFVDFNDGKTQLVSFDWSKTLVLLIWKWIALFLRKNNLLRCWRLPILSKLDSGSYIIPPRKLGPWFVLWSFFLLWLLCIAINLPSDSDLSKQFWYLLCTTKKF